MKRYIVTALLTGILTAGAIAQPNPEEREERIQAFRVAMFTNYLKLNSEEAQGFWPIYNEFLENRERLQQQLKPAKQLDAMNDSEVEEQIKRHLELRQRELDLEKELYQKLRGVLPVRKIAKIPLAEREFREALVKKMQEARERKQERQDRRGGRR